MITDVDEATFQQEVINQKEVLVDFWAPWCGPCKALTPVLKEFADRHPDIKIAKLNIDQSPGIAQAYNIVGIPVLLLFHSGQVVRRVTGNPGSARKLEELLK